MDKLSNQEQSVVDKLIDPDQQQVKATYQWSESFQRVVLGMLLCNRFFLVQSLGLVQPNYFLNEIHELVCKLVLEHFDKYNQQPSKIWLREQITELLKKRYREGETAEAMKLLYTGELNTVYDYYTRGGVGELMPGLDSTEAILDKVTAFAKTQAMKMALWQCHQLIKKDPESDATWTKVSEITKEASLVGRKLDLGLEYFGTIDERYDRMSKAEVEKDVFTTGFRKIDEGLNFGGLRIGEIGAWMGTPGSGKCHLITDIVMTYDLSCKQAGDVRLGDLLMGDDGTPRKVLSIHKGYDEMYEVWSPSGYICSVNSEHILVLKRSANMKKHRPDRNGKRYGYILANHPSRIPGTSYYHISVRDYLCQSKNFLAKTKGYRVGLDFSDKDLELDPYILGVWLGDGNTNSPGFTNGDTAVLRYLSKWGKGLGLKLLRKKGRCCWQYYFSGNCGLGAECILTWQLIKNSKLKVTECITELEKLLPNYKSKKLSKTVVYRWYKKAVNYVCKNGFLPDVKMPDECSATPNKLLNLLRHYNVLGNKHIPSIYKSSGRNQRLELLAGIIDTDGSLSGGGYDLVFKSKMLADDVVFLARSLGFAVSINLCKKKWQTGYVGEYYRICISGDCSVIPVKILRKKASKRRQIKNQLVYGITLKSVGVKPYVGFETDGNHLFLLADFTVVHNSLCLVKGAVKNIFHRNKKVLYISTEMDQDLIANRFDSMITKIGQHQLIQRRVDVKEAINQQMMEFDDSRRLYIKQFPSGTADINTIKAFYAQLVMYGFKPDLLIMDYPGDLKDMPGMDSWESRWKTLRDIRGFGVEEKHCTLIAIQPNRSASKLTLDELMDESMQGESFYQNKVLDAFWTITQTKDEKQAQVARASVAKARNGKSRYDFKIEFDYEKQTLDMWEVSEDRYRGRMGKIVSKGVDKAASRIDSIVKPADEQLEQLEIESKESRKGSWTPDHSEH